MRVGDFDSTHARLRASFARPGLNGTLVSPGVYMFRDEWPGMPVRYVGKSKDLYRRLSGYLDGSERDRPPSYQVIRRQILRNDDLRRRYLSPPSHTAQKVLARDLIANGGLQFRYAVVKDVETADLIERLLIDLHRDTIWNERRPSGVHFPAPPDAAEDGAVNLPENDFGHDDLLRTLTWLRQSGRPVGAVVHTLIGGKPARCEQVRKHAWRVEPEDWAHGWR